MISQKHAGQSVRPRRNQPDRTVSLFGRLRTYIKVTVDNKNPAVERWISPADGTVEFHGQHISVRVLDRDAVQITKNGEALEDDDDDVTVN
jgi:hypothetical protein